MVLLVGALDEADYHTDLECSVLLLTLSAALALDSGPYQQLLRTYVDEDGNVDYVAVREGSEIDEYRAALAVAEVPSSDDGRAAFWINAYNALTIGLIADNFPLNSIMELDGGSPWDTRIFTVAGQQVTLNHIEHQLLRPMGDPRIHAALSCASRGCPPLRRTVFTADHLDAQLDAASRDWLQGGGVQLDVEGNQVTLSRLFEWYADDFAPASLTDIAGVDGAEEAAINFAAGYLPEHAAWLLTGGYTVAWSPYDWGLNAR